jgi:hypothetical protein
MRVATASIFFVILSIYTVPADAGRNLNNLRILLSNLDRTGALDARYYDGTNVLLSSNSDGAYVKSHIQRVQGELQRAVGLWKALTPEQQSSTEGRALGQTLQKWLDYDTQLVAAYNKASTSRSQGDAKCVAFQKEVMTNERMYSIINLAGRSDNTGGSPGSLEEIKERAKFVAAACARPEFKDVGKNSCGSWKVGSNPLFNPEEWCEVAPRWREILSARVDRDVAKMLGSFDRRPLLAGQLQGDQSLTFFSRAVPDRDGWREAFFWQDLALPAEWRDKYLERINGMYAAIEVEKRIDASALAPIERAFEQLRADADQTAPSFKAPRSEGSDYSVNLAKSQVAKLPVK